MKTGPKPKCLCGEDKCRTCHARKYKATKRAALKRTALKRSSKPIARKTAVKVRRSKPRRVAVLRDPAYRQWLRDKWTCFVCWDISQSHCGRTEAAHLDRVNGTGSKGPDSGCGPLGVWHHRELHRIGAKDFETKYGVDLKARAAEYYALYLIWKESQQ